MRFILIAALLLFPISTVAAKPLHVLMPADTHHPVTGNARAERHPTTGRYLNPVRRHPLTGKKLHP